MDRDRVVSILRFLSQATWREVRKRQIALVRERKLWYSRERLSDVEFELRLVEDDMKARLEVARATGKPPR